MGRDIFLLLDFERKPKRERRSRLQGDGINHQLFIREGVEISRRVRVVNTVSVNYGRKSADDYILDLDEKVQIRIKL